MSSPARKKAVVSKKTKKSSGAESDSEGGRPSRTKRAPERLDPAEGASGSDTPRRGSARRRSLSVERKKKRGPGRPRKTASGSRSPAKKSTRATATKRRRVSKKDDEEEAKEYEVETLLDVQFLVKWKGYAKSSATWEPVKNLQACDDMVLAYLDKVKQQLLDAAEERKEEEKKKESDEDEEDEENEAAAKEEKEKKRKADAEKEAPSTPKRGRGRPPKKAKANNKNSEKEEDADS